MNYEEHFDRSVKLRNEFWAGIGKVHEDVVAHFINPAFMGGPAWPSIRQAFIKIDTPQGTIVASDGLSDPYSDFDANPNNQTYNGIGCEFYLECDEVIEDFQAFQSSWQFQVLYQMAQQAASNPNIGGIIEEYTYISTELYDCNGVPEELVNEEGRIGVLIGLPSATIPSRVQLSIENIRMVNVKLLTLSELSYIVQNGPEGRIKLGELLLQQEKSSKSFLERQSVI
jgi:hypothetical protein